MTEINFTELPIKPLFDSWGFSESDIYWSVEPEFDFQTANLCDANAWFSDSLTLTLDSYSELIRFWRVLLVTDAQHSHQADTVTLTWNSSQLYSDFIQTTLQTIHAYPAPLARLELNVDLYAYARFPESPCNPQRHWIRTANKLNFFGGSNHGCNPGIFFNLDISLFCQWTTKGDNAVLFALNQSLLKKSLQQWETHFGSITSQGPSSIYAYGFQPIT